MISGEGSAFVHGITAQEVFDFVMDPQQYLKANTRITCITRLAETDEGMIAREDGRFMGRFEGSVISRYRWDAPRRIDTTLEHGHPAAMHAWWEIEDRADGVWMKHVETLAMPKPIGRLFDLCARGWLSRSVQHEIDVIAQLLSDGERGRGLAALA
jgi:hypothetical protein